ncbi:MAG: hypothetical protein E7228_00080 [Clostridiales bacterium]|nr:hypothetical protein [Clostridiales bacterium]
MGVLAFLLVLLLCIPIAFLIWKLLNNLLENIKNQQDASEEVRMRKAAYQGSRKYSSRYDHRKYDHNIRYRSDYSSRYDSDHDSKYRSDHRTGRNRRDRG